jgi:hypothetical protein
MSDNPDGNMKNAVFTVEYILEKTRDIYEGR